MGLAGGKLATVAVAIVLSLSIASCGGDNDDSTASDSTSAAQTQPGGSAGGSNEGKEGSKSKQSSGAGGSTAKKHDDPGGGSAQYKTSGGDNSVQEFGKEGSKGEFDQAAEAVHGFLDARVRGDWSAACSYLTAEVSGSLERIASESKKLADEDCGKTMEAISEGVPRLNFVEAAEAEIGSLRIEGDRGFVLYRGAEDLFYAMPMKREDGIWKVASLAAAPLN